jgi:outer membrane biosynthesis protein TonB
MNDKRIEVINADKSVPKKTKIVQSKNQAPPEAGGSSSEVKPRKAPRPRRVAIGRKKTTESTKISMPPEAGGGPIATQPSDDAIRLRAYFISERRRRFALPGDAESDWLEANRQLLFEADRR